MFILDNLRMVKDKVKVIILILMETFTEGIGLMIKKKEMEEFK